MVKIITAIACIMLVGCNSTNIACSAFESITKKHQLVRLTVYWKDESKRCHNKTSTGEILCNYKTIAADPRDFPYYTKISIPEINIRGIVHDTGAALRTRRAAKRCGKNVPVLDLYIENKQEALAFIKKAPMFVTAYY